MPSKKKSLFQKEKIIIKLLSFLTFLKTRFGSKLSGSLNVKIYPDIVQ